VKRAALQVDPDGRFFYVWQLAVVGKDSHTIILWSLFIRLIS